MGTSEVEKPTGSGQGGKYTKEERAATIDKLLDRHFKVYDRLAEIQMNYLTLQDIQSIIARMNERYKMDITIINEGQLEFALEKPELEMYGREIYPKLH